MGKFDGFVSYLQAELGDSLRIARSHRGDTHHLLYAREDIRKTRGHKVAKVSGYLTESGQQTGVVEDTFGLGGLHWSAARFHDALIFRFYFRQNAGVIVSIDPDTELDVLSFTAECERRLVDVVGTPPRF